MKIQVLAVAAASLAVAATALPAQAGVYERARLTCSFMEQGYGAKAAIGKGLRLTRNWGSSETFVNLVMSMCRPAATAALGRDEGRLPSAPRYTGGNTTISEDPFEF